MSVKGLKCMVNAEFLDYNELFTHVENLKKVLLVATGRTGSDFFQSLLDGHSEILQFTGIWYFHQWWKEAKCKENLTDLINEFIWHNCIYCNHIAKFKSYYNKEERWDQLGNNKNEFFEVDINIFRQHMLNILGDKELNSRNFFLGVNLAYGLSVGSDIKKTKIIFYHIHHIPKLKEFKEDFEEFDVIAMTREPRNTLVSGIEHWKRYNVNTYNSGFLYQLLNRIFEESEPATQYTKNVKTLKLEDLHLFSKEILEEFCKIYGLKFEDCLFKSSYHGRKWWGDALSVQYLDGFNRHIMEKKWKDKLFFYDNFLIGFILKDRLKHHGYSYTNKMPKIYLPFVFFLIILPMKYELKMLIYNFRNCKSLKDKNSVLLRATFFYVSRVLLYFRFVWRRITKRIFLADLFYSEWKLTKELQVRYL